MKKAREIVSVSVRTLHEDLMLELNEGTMLGSNGAFAGHKKEVHDDGDDSMMTSTEMYKYGAAIE